MNQTMTFRDFNRLALYQCANQQLGWTADTLLEFTADVKTGALLITQSIPDCCLCHQADPALLIDLMPGKAICFDCAHGVDGMAKLASK